MARCVSECIFMSPCDPRAGFNGTLCENIHPASACYRNPCQNGGKCTNLLTLQDYICTCPSEYRGEQPLLEASTEDNMGVGRVFVLVTWATTSPGPLPKHVCCTLYLLQEDLFVSFWWFWNWSMKTVINIILFFVNHNHFISADTSALLCVCVWERDLLDHMAEHNTNRKSDIPSNFSIFFYSLFAPALMPMLWKYVLLFF